MRIRSIKPEFFLHEGLFAAEKEAKLPLRLAFAGLWCAADRDGRFKWEPRRLGVSILPYDTCDFSRVLDALTTRGFIVKYRVGDVWYGCIPSFPKHQIINNREKGSELPDISESEDVDACPTRAPRVDEVKKIPLSGREGKGKEGNMEGKGEGASLTLPADLDAADFREAWAQFIEHRKQKKKPLTGMAAEMQLRALAEIGKARAIAAIRYSIAQGWQGIFESNQTVRNATNTAARRAAEYPESTANVPDDTPTYDPEPSNGIS